MTNEDKLNQALEAERKRQSEELVIDFDQALDEQRKKCIKIKYGREMYRWKVVYWLYWILSWFGVSMEPCYRAKVYTVPGETPQWYMNIILRKLHKARELDFDNLTEEQILDNLEVSDREHDEIFRRLFGDEFVDSYLNDNLVSKAVLTNEVLNPVLEKWGWVPVTDTTEKKTTLSK